MDALTFGASQESSDRMTSVDDLLTVGDEIAATLRTGPLLETARLLLRTVSNSMRSVLILVEHGCGTDALKLARTMFETAVNIHYLHSHPDSIQDYEDFLWIKRKKHHDYVMKFAPAQAQPMGDESLSELASEYARVQQRFTGPKGKVRNRWQGPDYREIARSVGGEIIYDGVYPSLSSLMHMDILGLTIAKAPSGDVEPVPSDVNLELGLQIAVWSYAMALSAADEVLTGNSRDRIQSAFNRFRGSSSTTRDPGRRQELAGTGEGSDRVVTR